MGTRDPRIDNYIDNAKDFAKPILEHMRELVHKACPDVVETMKWSSPHFDHKGIMCAMMSFNEHCSFGFWKESLIEGLKGRISREGAGSLGAIKTLTDLPKDKEFIALIKEAAELNEKGIKAEINTKSGEKKKDIVVPKDLTAALKNDPKAAMHFEAFSPSKKREYISWLEEAKSDATREKRLATAIEWIGEGKARNWKYETKK
jgi:uncharacterized protein YdeI (YjbR/CyaY-like superfamily)